MLVNLFECLQIDKIKKGKLKELNTVGSYTLNQVSITLMDNNICVRNLLSERQICAGETSPIIHDSCQVNIFYVNILFK
jgi:hypothetical protein